MKKFLKIMLIILIPMVFMATTFSVGADDDEDEREEEEKEDDDDDDNDRNGSRTTTETVVSEPSVSTKIEKTTQTIVFKDGDGDGILDSEDPHPSIAEIYIVEDKNLNGIVDKFEK